MFSQWGAIIITTRAYSVIAESREEAREKLMKLNKKNVNPDWRSVELTDLQADGQGLRRSRPKQ